MMSAIQVETDSHNTHMLLGGLLLCVQDSVSFEDTESGASDVHSTSAKDERNLLSSGERGHIKFKFYISPYFLENSFLICLMMPFIILHLSHFYQTFLSHFTQKQNPIKNIYEKTNYQLVRNVALILSLALHPAMEIQAQQLSAMSRRVFSPKI